MRSIPGYNVLVISLVFSLFHAVLQEIYILRDGVICGTAHASGSKRLVVIIQNKNRMVQQRKTERNADTAIKPTAMC